MHICGNIYGFLWESTTRNNCNTYLIDGPSRILIDPGHLSLFDHVRQGLADRELDIEDIDVVICTHAHPDHLEAVQLFHPIPALTAYHQQDWAMVKTLMEHYGAGFSADIEAVRPDFFLTEGDLAIGGNTLQVYHTPGHAPGAVCLYHPEQKALFSGDVIFKEGIGRCDLPGGDDRRLKESIQHLATLDVEWILPGHGPIVSGSQEVKRTFERIERYWLDVI